MGDLKSNKAIYFKACLFLIILVACAVALLLEVVIWRRAVFIIALIWSSARLYYFMFYVIENYVDEDFKFSSVYAFLVYLLARRNRSD